LILSIAREFLEKRVAESSYWLEKVEDLLSALRGDGWEFSKGKLIPTTPEPASLAPETSMLQQELTKFHFNVAEVHYQQALENFREHRFESSNGQLRSFLESLYIELCKRKTGKAFADASAAIQHLFQAGAIEGGEYNLARGLFEASNERGAHHGLTDSEEALFRFHFSTAFSRYLVARLRN
jgi:hypothetical protein